MKDRNSQAHDALSLIQKTDHYPFNEFARSITFEDRSSITLNPLVGWMIGKCLPTCSCMAEKVSNG